MTTSYGVFLLGIPHFALITAFVVIGVAAVFLSMPLSHQPAVTARLISLGSGYVYYGPHPSELSEVSLCAFSSVVVMLACVPLYDALRSSGPKALAALILAPLFLASLMHLTDIGRYSAGLVSADAVQTYYPFYFEPRLFMNAPDPFFFKPSFFRVIVEVVKWSACLTIAVWLSVATVMAWRQRGRVCAAPDDRHRK